MHLSNEGARTRKWTQWQLSLEAPEENLFFVNSHDSERLFHKNTYFHTCVHQRSITLQRYSRMTPGWCVWECHVEQGNRRRLNQKGQGAHQKKSTARCSCFHRGCSAFLLAEMMPPGPLVRRKILLIGGTQRCLPRGTTWNTIEKTGQKNGPCTLPPPNHREIVT